MSDSIFGWDLLIKSVETDIKSNQDILLCLTHLVLVSGGFKCIGLGESKTIDGTENKTETLPRGWSTANTIRYLNQGRLYHLKVNKLSDALCLNLLRLDERTSAVLQLNNANVVTTHTSPLSQMLPQHDDLIESIRTQLIDKVIVSKRTKDMSVQTDSQGRRPSTSNSSPLRPSIPHVPDLGGSPPFVPSNAHQPIPGGLGSDDLYPFGRNPLGGAGGRLGVGGGLGVGGVGIGGGGVGGGGGGMLFQPEFGGHGRLPSQPGALPPGAVPPGARFDPYRPPDVDRFPRYRPPPNRPDNDELPPPGYDDMYM